MKLRAFSDDPAPVIVGADPITYGPVETKPMLPIVLGMLLVGSLIGWAFLKESPKEEMQSNPRKHSTSPFKPGDWVWFRTPGGYYVTATVLKDKHHSLDMIWVRTRPGGRRITASKKELHRENYMKKHRWEKPQRARTRKMKSRKPRRR